MQFVLPKTEGELLAWSELFSNCLYRHIGVVHERKCAFYGGYRNNKLRFIVEVGEGEILQAHKRFNEELHGSDEETVGRWFADRVPNQPKPTGKMR